jgi:hypothetical protein
MTLTTAFLWFLFPCIGSYIGSKLFQYKSKKYKDPFDPKDPSTWNYSYTRLMRMK